MDITIQPGLLSGRIRIIPSKSQAHRLLICAAFADSPTHIICPETNRDIEATAGCLRALGADIQHTEKGYDVTPVRKVPDSADLYCHDSGSTLRFLLPLAGALGTKATFHLEGRLPQRPLSPLWEEMERMGCQLSRPSSNTLLCSGQLRHGIYSIDGGVSSQFITGLLLAFPLIGGETRLILTGKIESKPYISMTQQAMALFGVDAAGYCISGQHSYHSPGSVTVEGDWSNGAFFLAAKALGSAVEAENLSLSSTQGDKAVHVLLQQMNENLEISVEDIPDLVPILAVFAACRQGAKFCNIQRLRLKESDRVSSVVEMIHALGGKAEPGASSLTIYGTGLTGGTADSKNDHRIAMAAAIAATVCKTSVTILGAECTDKSYPSFWAEYRRLGGNYELNLR